MWIAAETASRVLGIASVGYVDREIATFWNKRKHGDDIRTFTGWYWVGRHRSNGPFKTRSAAIRDAYYNLVLNIEPPITPLTTALPSRRRRLVPA